MWHYDRNTGAGGMKLIIRFGYVFEDRLFHVKDRMVFGKTAKYMLWALVNEIPSEV